MHHLLTTSINIWVNWFDMRTHSRVLHPPLLESHPIAITNPITLKRKIDSVVVWLKPIKSLHGILAVLTTQCIEYPPCYITTNKKISNIIWLFFPWLLPHSPFFKNQINNISVLFSKKMSFHLKVYRLIGFFFFMSRRNDQT